MAGVNKVILLGNIGKDPEIRVTESGRKVANFPLATSETYKDKNGEKVENTEWHNIVFWGPVADTIEKYVKKGSQLYVEGKLRTRSYEAKEGGKRYITEVLGDTFTFVGAPKNSDNAGSSSSSQAASKPSASSQVEDKSFVADESDDLPF